MKASDVEELGKEWRKLVKYSVRTIDELEDEIWSSDDAAGVGTRSMFDGLME